MKRILQVRVLGAEYGDCRWIEYGDSTSPHRILVDAGTPGTSNRLKPLLDSVRGDDPSHELFLITHVDEDHIGGGLKVLADPEAAGQFRHVWLTAAGTSSQPPPKRTSDLYRARSSRGPSWIASFPGTSTSKMGPLRETLMGVHSSWNCRATPSQPS